MSVCNKCSILYLLCMLQSAIWQCLNNYDYTDAVFLSERLFAEGETVLLILNFNLHSVCLTIMMLLFG